MTEKSPESGLSRRTFLSSVASGAALLVRGHGPASEEPSRAGPLPPIKTSTETVETAINNAAKELNTMLYDLGWYSLVYVKSLEIVVIPACGKTEGACYYTTNKDDSCKKPLSSIPKLLTACAAYGEGDFQDVARKLVETYQQKYLPEPLSDSNKESYVSVIAPILEQSARRMGGGLEHSDAFPEKPWHESFSLRFSLPFWEHYDIPVEATVKNPRQQATMVELQSLQESQTNPPSR